MERPCDSPGRAATVPHLDYWRGLFAGFQTSILDSQQQPREGGPKIWVGSWHHLVHTFKDYILPKVKAGMLPVTLIPPTHIPAQHKGLFLTGLLPHLNPLSHALHLLFPLPGLFLLWVSVRLYSSSLSRFSTTFSASSGHSRLNCYPLVPRPQHFLSPFPALFCFIAPFTVCYITDLLSAFPT